MHTSESVEMHVKEFRAARDILILEKAGPARTGTARGSGIKFHAVPGRIENGILQAGKAFCGQYPKHAWASTEGERVTCPRCIAKLNRIDAEMRRRAREQRMTQNGTRLVRVPPTFISDRMERDLPCGTVEIGKRDAAIEADEATLRDILDDAQHYAENVDQAGLWLINSARATVKALRAQRVTLEGSEQ